MLKIENVRKVFNEGTVNEKVALNGLNLHMKEGEFVTVIGGNGAGKSTMLNAIAGVWGVDEGKIWRMAPICDGYVKMANLAVLAGHSTNGVSALHSEILKDSVFHDFYT